MNSIHVSELSPLFKTLLLQQQLVGVFGQSRVQCPDNYSVSCNLVQVLCLFDVQVFIWYRINVHSIIISQHNFIVLILVENKMIVLILYIIHRKCSYMTYCTKINNALIYVLQSKKSGMPELFCFDDQFETLGSRSLTHLSSRTKCLQEEKQKSCCSFTCNRQMNLLTHLEE